MDQHQPGKAGPTTMEEKDYNLLRPFDLEAAKRGEKIHDVFGGVVVFIDGPDAGGRLAVQIDGHFAVVLGETLRMSPLCWVEGKPVYKGDVLYVKNPTGRTGSKVTAEFKENGDGASPFRSDNGAVPTIRMADLTWTPKVRREGWVNIYPRALEELAASVSHAYASKGAADALAVHGRIDCIRIEWEEPAGQEGAA